VSTLFPSTDVRCCLLRISPSRMKCTIEAERRQVGSKMAITLSISNNESSWSVKVNNISETTCCAAFRLTTTKLRKARQNKTTRKKIEIRVLRNCWQDGHHTQKSHILFLRMKTNVRIYKNNVFMCETWDFLVYLCICEGEHASLLFCLLLQVSFSWLYILYCARNGQRHFGVFDFMYLDQLISYCHLQKEAAYHQNSLQLFTYSSHYTYLQPSIHSYHTNEQLTPWLPI